ncbi:MAG: class I tRNA ligase family protein, partial [Acidobacteria bacterium]|nr:class I tRNA ligase family protein [Acidobacteriota bacterium]
GLRRATHRTIRRVTADLDQRLHLNTAISAIMELGNALHAFVHDGIRDGGDRAVAREALTTAFLLLAPLAPHLAEEALGQILGPPPGAAYPWPPADPALLQEEEAEVVVQVNGRLRAQIRVPVDSGEEEVFRRAAAHPKVAPHLQDREVRRRIYLPGRLLNIVVSGGAGAGKVQESAGEPAGR